MISPSKMELKEIPLDMLEISDLNVRKHSSETGLFELSESIREIGVQQPIIVVPKHNGKYEVIVGQRRYLASIKADKKTIPAIIKKVKNDTEAIILSFSENIHRQDLKYEDKNRVAEILFSKYGTVQAVAKQIGVTNQTVRNYLGYSIVPAEMKVMVENKEISATTAIRIARAIESPENAINVAKMVKETPRSADKNRIINIARNNPNVSPKNLEKIVKLSKFKKVTLDLAPRVSEALQKASETYNTDSGEIVLEALIGWLSERGFLQ